MRLSPIEALFIQMIVYTVIYIINPYLGFLICLIAGIIALAILLLSFVFELLDKSKVPRSYYWHVLIASVAPLLVLGFYSIFISGSFDWMQE